MQLDGFLNYFRGQKNLSEEVFLLSYLSAYDALPTAVSKDPEGFWKLYYLARYPALGWYTHMCLLTGRPSDPFSAVTFEWHRGRLSNGREYMILQYPVPESLGLGVRDFEQGERSETAEILYPYFSAILRTTTQLPAECYALGQAPIDGLTTLRLCRSAAHYNLGYGPAPTLEAFVEALGQDQQREVLGCVVRYPDHLDSVDQELLARVAAREVTKTGELPDDPKSRVSMETSPHDGEQPRG